MSVNLPKIVSFSRYQPSKPDYKSYSTLAPLRRDTVSFGMSKSEFKGFELACANMLNAPIEDFKDRNSFIKWTKKELEKKYDIENQYKAKTPNGTVYRKQTLEEWKNYLTNVNEKYKNDPVKSLMVFHSVSKDLDEKSDGAPPVFDAAVLSDTMDQIEADIKDNKNVTSKFLKMYENNLQAMVLLNDNTGETETKWVKLPSLENDPKNFNENVKKVRILSHDRWCIKRADAETYLRKGDLHIYLEEGKPEVVLCLENGSVSEIQGVRNNSNIPVKSTEIIDKYIKSNCLKCIKSIETKIEKAKEDFVKFNETKAALETVNKEDPKAVFEYFKLLEKVEEDGMLVIKEYKQPSENYTFKDLGLRESNLFKKPLTIRKSANFKDSQITSLGNLKSIGHFAVFKNSQITDLGNLKSIGWDAYFSESQITDLGNLQSIGRDADFSDSRIISLGNLKSIGWDAIFADSKVEDLGKLKSIGKNAYINRSPLTVEHFMAAKVDVKGEIKAGP